MHKYGIRYIDNGLLKIKKYLEKIDLIELEILHSKLMEKEAGWTRRWSESEKRWKVILIHEEEGCILWDREKMIKNFLGTYTIFSKGGLFDFIERETKGELKFGKF